MQIIVTGGTGFIGPGLIWRLTELGHQVTVVSRRDQDTVGIPNHVDFIQDDPTREGEWQEAAAQADAAINLAGASIFQRWSHKTKKRIYDSRILTTRHLATALASGGGTGRFESAPGTLDVADLAGRLLKTDSHDIYRQVHNEVDRILLNKVLQHLDDNQVWASRRLGISRTTLRNKLADLEGGDP